KDDRAWEFIDPILQCEISYSITKRYVYLAILCVQEKAVYRPTISKVISILTHEIVNLPLLISMLFKLKKFS
ncbi:hypothetical protein CISIN_1g037372mg, partial [Citrus sinensis]